MKPKSLVLFVEGYGETEAAPRLVKRILTEQAAWDCVFLEADPYRVGHFQRLKKNDYREWVRWLKASAKGGNLAGVLLILDGDSKRSGSKAFCAADEARALAARARDAGAGTVFSVSVVFAMQEFESWFIAGLPSLVGKRLSDGRKILDAQAPSGDLEFAPRGAKEWLNGVVEDGYKPTRDQAELVDIVDLQMVRERPMRSFRRLDQAIARTVAAVRSNTPIVDPAGPIEKATS